MHGNHEPSFRKLAICGARATGLLAARADDSSDAAKSLGISFSSGTGRTLILERDGKRYQVDVAAKTVQEIAPGAETAAALFQQNCAVCHSPNGKGVAAMHTPDFTNPAFERTLSDQDIGSAIRNGKAGGRMPAWSGHLTEAQIDSLSAYIRSFSHTDGATGASASSGQQQEPPRTIYEPGDDVIFSLPTGRAVDEHGLYVNFAHRFPYDAAFTGRAAAGSCSAWTTSRSLLWVSATASPTNCRSASSGRRR